MAGQNEMRRQYRNATPDPDFIRSISGKPSDGQPYNMLKPNKYSGPRGNAGKKNRVGVGEAIDYLWNYMLKGKSMDQYLDEKR